MPDDVEGVAAKEEDEEDCTDGTVVAGDEVVAWQLETIDNLLA